jgi:hypothetical protein
MIVIDMVQHTAKNLSIIGMTDSQPRIGGAMQYVPGLGMNGVLVALGGRIFFGKRTVSSQDKGHLLDFGTVDVFDIDSYLTTSRTDGNGAWYTQRTSGNLPQARIDFCTVVSSAKDNSSHNIWVYGGRDPTTDNGTTYFDDTYVLSLPSFTWIKMHQGTKPRWGHTCHLAGGNQMITVGGHNEFEDICDWHTTGVGVLDLQRAVWGKIFQASGNNLGLNFKITDRIGGTESGNASKRQPDSGWASEEFGSIMNRTRIYDNYSGTIIATGSKSHKESTKAEAVMIVGASVGAAVFVASFAYLSLVYRRYRNPAAPTESSKPDDLEEHIEIGTISKFELPNGHERCETSGSGGRHEFAGASARTEADGGNAVTYAAELPCTNFGMNGRWGIPVVRTQEPASSGSDSVPSWTSADDAMVSARRSEPVDVI